MARPQCDGRLTTLRGCCAGHAERSLHTQLAIDTERVFLGYRHTSLDASEVTFNLKDFKAMLVRPS